MADPKRNQQFAQALKCFRAGDFYQAEQVCLALVKRDRHDADALEILANVAVQRGFMDQAREHFEHLVRLRPHDPATLTNLGKIRAGQGELQQAIAAYDRALKLKGDYGSALASKADALNRLGDAAAARAVLERAIAAGDDDAEIALIYATILQQAGEHEQALALAARCFDQPGCPTSAARLLGFVMGNALESLRRYDEAFAAYRKANAIDAEGGGGGGGRFDAADFVNSVDQLIAFFTRERLAKLPRAMNDSRLPVFIAGMARSGTTLVEQIIHAHPNAIGAGELPDLDVIVADLPTELASLLPYPQCLTAMTPADANRLSARYLGRLRSIAGGARAAAVTPQRVVDKNLRNVHHLGLIALLFPQAAVIHCRREPLDTCLSCYLSPLPQSKHPYASDLRSIGLVHRQCERLMAHWKNVLELPTLEVVYEELVADKERVTRRIIEHIGLEWDDRCLRPHEAQRAVRTLSYDQVRRPIYASSVARHERFAAHLEPLRESLRSDQMI